MSPVFPSGRLFSGKDLTPDFDVTLSSRAQPEKFDTTLPGNSGNNPTNAQFYTYLATLPSWSAAAVTNPTQFNAAASAIDASGPAAGVIKMSASFSGTLVPPNRPLPSGVQPDPTTCMIYVVPETLPGSFPQPAADGAAGSVWAVKASLPVVRSKSGVDFHGWHAVDHSTGGMAQYGYRWIGIRFNVRSDGGVTNYARVAANYLSRRIILDRCYIDGVTDETAGGIDIEQPPGFLIDGRYNASLDCWYDNIMSAQSEKQCITLINGGPTKIVGNVLSGNGEAFMSGGTDPQLAILLNDAHAIGIYMTLTATGAGATGKTLTITVSKGTGSFVAGAGSVVETNSGYYQYTPTAGEVNTLGRLRINASATGCPDTLTDTSVVATISETNYPRDLEFRRNFCRQQFGATPLHPAFAQLTTLGGNARLKRSGMTAAAYNAGTRTLTLSAGTFDTSQVTRPDTFRRIRFWYVASGAGAGSYGEVSTYNSTTSVTSDTVMFTPHIVGAAIDATSQIEVREAIEWISKNCFELKCMRRAYIEGCVLENAWDMDGQQRMISNLKSVNQGYSDTSGAIPGGYLSLTQDITWVNSLLLNSWGGVSINSAPSQPCLAAGKMHLENLLFVATPHLDFVGGQTSSSMPLQLGADTLTFKRLAARNFQRSVLAPWQGSNDTDAGIGSEHTLLNLVIDGYLAVDAPENHIHGSRIDTGFAQGVAAYTGNVDTATATWRVGIANSATVTNPATNYPSTANPGPAFHTYYTTDAAPWVNPLYDFTDPACDYSLKGTDTLAAQAPMGVDWPTLAAAVLTVRPSKTVVPYQWLGTETTSGPGIADHLAMSVQPAGAATGVALTTQPSVVVQDNVNATVTGDTSTVTASWVSLTGDAAPSGTLTKAAVSGVATFTNLALTWTVASTGYWHFTDGSLTAVNSNTLTLSGAAAPIPTPITVLPTIVDQWRPTQRNREGLEVIPSASPLIGTSGTTIAGSATTSVFIPVGRVKVSVLSLSIDAMQAALGSSTITAQVFSVKAGVSTALTAAQSIKTDAITQVGNFALPVLTALFDGPANGSRRIDGTAGNTLRVDLVANGTVTQQPILRVVAELAVNG